MGGEKTVKRSSAPTLPKPVDLVSMSLLINETHKIHLPTLEVLEKKGLCVGTDDAMAILEEGVASVNRENTIVKFPPYLAEDCI
jgi:trimethylamine:corrinoid methyltransferase-like protein